MSLLIMPVDRQAELSVIGCCLLGASLEVAEVVRATDFFGDDTAMAYAVVEDLVATNDVVSTETLMVRWASVWPKTKAPADILDTPSLVPGPSMSPFFSAKVRDMSRRRRVMESASRLATSAQDLSIPTDALIAEAEMMLDGEGIERLTRLDAAGFARATIEDVEERMQRGGAATGILTGLGRFDALTDGLQRGEQTILAARPSIGKTAIGVQVLERACLQNGEPTLFVTCEMSPAALGRRLAACHCEISMGKLRRGQLTTEEVSVLKAFQMKVRRAPMWILNCINGASSLEIAASIRRHTRQCGVRLVIIDYLQKIRPAARHEKRTYEVGEVSGTLRAVAVQCGVAMLTLAQLNRENEKDKLRLPRLADLADSSQIERDADVVGLLHRERDAENTEAVLIVAKNRDGEVGAVPLKFDGQFCKFQVG